MEKTKPIAVETKVVHKKQLTHDVFELHLESNPPFQFQPGQFYSIVIPGAGPGGRDLRRAYSIASSPENPIIELCVKLVDGGPGTNFLNNLKIGDVCKGMAPYGDFVFKTKPGKDVIFVATGTGIAPYRAMIYSKVYAENKPRKTTLLFGARDKNDLLYSEEMREILGDNMVETLSRCEGDLGNCHKGRVTDWLRGNAATIHWHETEFYLCGNGAMIDEVKAILAGHGVEKHSIHQEVYYKPKPGETHASQ
jgi:ferredoxin-NADP reductase